MSDESDASGSIWDVDSDIGTMSDESDEQQMEQAAVTVASVKFVPSHNADSGSFSAALDIAHTSVLEPPLGLSPILSSCIVVNYISAGYILLPWGESTRLNLILREHI